MLMMTAAPEQCTHQSILEVTGSLRMPVSDRLRQRVQALLACGERRILLDVSRLTHIDAAGVGELVHAFNITSAAGGLLQIAHAGGRVRRLLHLSGLLTLLTADQITPAVGRLITADPRPADRAMSASPTPRTRY